MRQDILFSLMAPDPPSEINLMHLGTGSARILQTNDQLAEYSLQMTI